MRALLALPLTILIVAAYNFMAFQNLASLEAAAVTATLMSGATVVLTWGDGLVAVGLLVLFIELLKAARVGSATILDHGLSMLVFIAALVEFLLVREAGTATFALVVVLCLIDVMAGFSVSIRTARRDVSVGRGSDF
jgi:hypothetical protein